MIVREYVHGFIERSKPVREAKISVLLEALSIPWLAEKGELMIHDNVVMANGIVVALIFGDAMPLVQRIGAHILTKAPEQA